MSKRSEWDVTGNYPNQSSLVFFFYLLGFATSRNGWNSHPNLIQVHGPLFLCTLYALLTHHRGVSAQS